MLAVGFGAGVMVPGTTSSIQVATKRFHVGSVVAGCWLRVPVLGRWSRSCSSKGGGGGLEACTAAGLRVSFLGVRLVQPGTGSLGIWM